MPYSTLPEVGPIRAKQSYLYEAQMVSENEQKEIMELRNKIRQNNLGILSQRNMGF